MALATSDVSARVGRLEVTIDSSISVAVMTGTPARFARSITSFCTAGRSPSFSSTPRSPRATITASATSRILLRLRIASSFSSFAITGVLQARSPRCFWQRRTSSGWRTNDSASQSTCSSTASLRSSWSFSVNAGIGSGRPGTLTPFRSPSSPPRTTEHSAWRPSTLRTTSSMRPSSSSTWSPRRSASTSSGWLISMWLSAGEGPSPEGASCARLVRDSPVRITVRPRTSRMNADSRGPVRILGPCRSPSSAIGRSAAWAASRTSAAAWRCVAWSPCEKFSRATSIPAWIIARSTVGDALAGPMVQTIRVRRTWAHLAFRLHHAAFELERADHRPTHAAHEVALKPV